jgi:hypothetical protein
MVGRMMTAITEVVEGKTIALHLHHVESKPLDFAYPPLAPEPPLLFRLSLLSGLGIAVLLFIYTFIQQLLKGFPLSLEKMEALRLPALGAITSFCDGPSVEIAAGGDLEVLRKVGLFSEGSKVIGLLAGKGPDYSYALGENLARKSVKSVIVRCDFLSPFRKDDGPGVLQIWKGEIRELPLRKGKGFDLLPSGGYTPFGPEIIQSPRFAQLIDLLKKSYDQIYLLFRSPLSSAESLAALSHCDKVAATVSGEKMEELTSLVRWGYDGDDSRLTFITRS